MLLVFSWMLMNCNPSKKLAQKTGEAPAVTYVGDIKPLMERSCAPCHFPDQDGRKAALDSYATVSKNAEDILQRVQLPETDKLFMPFKNKKEPFTQEEIELLKQWMALGKPN
jgi:hypothetical protein